MASTSMNLEALSDLSPDDALLFARFGVGRHQDLPFSNIHDAFDHFAASQPDTVAVQHLGESITCAELQHKANGLASRLRCLGVVPGTRVCLLVQRSVSMVIGILAILKAGGAYVPLDGGIATQSTLEHVIRDSGCILTLALEEYSHRITNSSVLSLEKTIASITSQDVGPENVSSPRDAAYVIYTSGTTGTPKGVEVTHFNVINLVCLSPGNVEMSPGRRVSQLLNIAFDMAAWEILGSLCNGCTLCIRGKSSKEWKAVMKTVDIVIATPSMMIPHNPIDYPNIKVVATAGEPCPQSLADSWSRTSHFYNSCGPTEITIVNTMQHHVVGESLSIGSPTPNNNVYILDEHMKPVPIGEVGVMWAGGAGVSSGYVNLPEKTAERFRLDVFAGDGTYMFNTGDLGKWRPDGKLDHLGRVDDQVKVKGFRVELDGVSAAMETCPSVKVAVALLVGTELWGFVTPEDVDVNDVIAATQKIQPYYAVPSHFKILSQLPHTSNGKVDKRSLRHMALEQLESDAVSFALEDVKVPQLRSDFYSQALYEGKLLSDIIPALIAPPPVYQQSLQPIVTEKLELSKQLTASSPGSSSSSSDGDLTSTAETGQPWDGYEDDPLPRKTHGRFFRNLRHKILSLYRRLFGIVFAVNVAILISIFTKGGANAQELGLVVVANFFCAILMRQDYVINAFFTACCAVPPSWPLAIRRICARVYHIGGLHSGCAFSSLMWLCVFTGQATRELLNKQATSAPTVAVTYFILMLVVGIVLFAYPKTRSTHHDAFEKTHRFLGWAATTLVWLQIIFLTNDYRPPGQTLGQALLHSPPFWLVAIMTCSIILPWLRLRKVPVRAEVLSPHAVRLYFDYVTPRPGHFTRISDSPLLEWHGFAAVPEPGMKGYSLVVSRAGDWTAKQITQPPTHLWVRGVPCYGVLRITTLFRRVVFVATGSGIGPCAPVILAQKVPIRLLWTSPNVRQTFGDKLVDSILDASPGAVIYNTRVHGKPDMVRLTYRLVREFNAEAVCIISNQQLTQKVVYGMMSRGIPAFGAIWDS